MRVREPWTGWRSHPRVPQDASTLREVPDNQEVWVDTATDASLIVECVEYQTDVQVRWVAPATAARLPRVRVPTPVV